MEAFFCCRKYAEIVSSDGKLTNFLEMGKDTNTMLIYSQKNVRVCPIYNYLYNYIFTIDPDGS